jgi:hypothetical protein
VPTEYVLPERFGRVESFRILRVCIKDGLEQLSSNILVETLRREEKAEESRTLFLSGNLGTSP